MEFSGRVRDKQAHAPGPISKPKKIKMESIQSFQTSHESPVLYAKDVSVYKP